MCDLHHLYTWAFRLLIYFRWWPHDKQCCYMENRWTGYKLNYFCWTVKAVVLKALMVLHPFYFVCMQSSAIFFAITVVTILCRLDESNVFSSTIIKPCPRDAIHQKEKYIHAKVRNLILVVSLSTQLFSFWCHCSYFTWQFL